MANPDTDLLALLLPADDDLTRALWDALLELADHEVNNWTLVGAQMVLLHAVEHNRVPPRRTSDLDVIVNVRSVSMSPDRFVKTLSSLGYELEGISADGVGHRFVRDPVKFDVLLPDGIGEGADRQVIPGVRSVEVPGGTQALKRTSGLPVQTDARKGMIPRPDLLGAILVKARAVGVDDLPDAQREDLAFLLSLVADPFEMRQELVGSEQKWLRRRSELLDPDAPPWRVVDNAEDARLALTVLSGGS